VRPVFFPLDRRLKISRVGWSERVQKQVVKLAARGSYGEAVELYRDLVGVSLQKTTAWQRTQERGQRLRAERERQAEQYWAPPKRQQLIPGEPLEAVNKAVSVDGAMVYILGEEWKEVKVGCVFEYATRARYDRRTQEWTEGVTAQQQSYTAHLGEPEPFSQLLAAEAERRGFYRAQQRAGIGDGAKWIWNMMSLCFPTVHEIVDWSHALSHLWQAAHVAYADNQSAAKRWVKPREDALWQGQVPTVVADIERLKEDVPDQAAQLETEAGYFRHNARRMQYQELREEGYPVGSGTVESGCKNLVAMRMRGPGMRWSRPGAENVLALRAECLSQRWEEAWSLTCPN
jgi:hypothetical protein